MANGSKRYVYDLDSLSEAMDYALRDPKLFPPKGVVYSHRDEGSQVAPWSGFNTWDQAERIATHGWQEGREKIAELSAKVFATVVGNRRMAPALHLSVAGFAPCIGAAIANAPESMFGIRKVMKEGSSGKIVHIVQNVFVSGGCSVESVMQRGIVAAALVDCLEALGYRVEFTWYMGGTMGADSHNGFIARFPLKRPEDPLDIDAFSAWIANPASFRRFGFALAEQIAPDKDINKSNYFTPSDLVVYPSEKGDLFIPEASLYEVGEQQAAVALRKYLSLLGVEFDS